VGIFSRNREPLDAEMREALLFGDANAIKVAEKCQLRIKNRLATLCQSGESLKSIITSSGGKDLLALTTHRIIDINPISSDFDLNIERSMVRGTEIGSLGTPPHSFLATIRFNRPIRQLGGKKEYTSNDFTMITRSDYDEALLVTSTVRRTFGVEACAVSEPRH
jgi:hypothetical protein